MQRAILCGLAIVVFAAGCHRTATTSAEQKGRRRGSGARGTIVSVDAAAGTLKVKVRSRQNPDPVEKTFQVEDDTTITSFTGENKTELGKGKGGLGDPQFKQGSQVSIRTSEEGGKVVSIQVGDLLQRGRNRNGKGAKQPVQ